MKLSRLRAPLVAITLSITATSALAENNNDIVEEVVVSALRIDTSVREAGSSISIIDAQLIEARASHYLADAIVSATGVTMNQNGPFGGQAAIRIRGASSGQTLVLIDGIVANDPTSPGGGFNFGAIDTLDVQSVEILKGPHSTLWGTDAIGGVINIVSKPADETLRAGISAEGGSFGSQRIAANVSAGNEQGDFRISYADVTTDGISKADEDDGNSEEDGFESQTLAIRGGLNLGTAARLDVRYRETDEITEYDGFGLATGVEDSADVSETNHSSAQVTLAFDLFGRLENTLTYGHTELERENFNAGVAGFSSAGERRVFRYQGAFDINEQHSLSFGYETEDSESGNLDTTVDGVFALYSLQPVEDVTVSLGIRRDDHDNFGSKTVGRVAAAWQLSDNVLLRSSWGEGFKAPSIFQSTFFCCGATAANTALKPEFSDAFDVGVEYRFADQRGTLSATYFDQQTEDLITFSFAVGGYENIEEVDTQGVELELGYQFSEQWQLNANFTWLDSEDGTGNEQIRLPETTADISLGFAPTAAISTNLIVTYNDDEGDSRGTVDSWTRVDLAGSYRVNPQLSFYARIENVTDTDYQQIFGYGTPERSGHVGLRYQF